MKCLHEWDLYGLILQLFYITLAESPSIARDSIGNAGTQEINYGII
jgi:hypothetical protein